MLALTQFSRLVVSKQFPDFGVLVLGSSKAEGSVLHPHLFILFETFGALSRHLFYGLDFDNLAIARYHFSVPVHSTDERFFRMEFSGFSLLICPIFQQLRLQFSPSFYQSGRLRH